MAVHGDLLRVLRAALVRAPEWWRPGELLLATALTGLGAPDGDLLARLAARTRTVARRSGLAEDDRAIARLCASGWLTTVRPADDLAGVVACLGLDELGLAGPRAAAEAVILGDPLAAGRLERFGPFLALTGGARRFLDLALLVAFGGDGDLGLLARLALGQLAPDPGSPLGGATVRFGPLPWTDRAAAEDYLAARAARAAGPDFATALAEVERRAGEPLHLVHHHLTAAHHWTRLLWESAATPAQRRRARRALRRAPCSAALARTVWEDLYAAWQPRPAAARLAQAFAGCDLWNSVERAAWAARAVGGRRMRRRVWPERVFDAWLDHGAHRVVAEGETVERLALRRLLEDGWQGVHAEGGFWLATAHLLLDGDECPAVPWIGPLQAVPVDWGRRGYGVRRRAAITRRAAALIRDPEAALAAALARARHPLPGFLAAPEPAALTAVVRHLPRRVLVALARHLLDAPAEAAGLPDLVVWCADRVALWEVKSPGDQLRPEQRRWLAWFAAEGVTAGVVRFQAKRAVQQTLFGGGGVTVARAPRLQAPAAPGARSTAAGPRLLLGATCWEVQPGIPVPGCPGVITARRPWRDVRAELPFVDDRLVPLPAAAVLIERRDGRRTVLRRWFPLPPGYVVVAAQRDEALPAGGIGPTLRILTRTAGWLVPAALAAEEPVIARRNELDDPTRDWIPHPDEPPPRPDRVAEAWGCGDELRDQLLLIGAEPHGVWTHHDHLLLATAPGCAVLWSATSPRLRTGTLPWHRAV